MTDNGPSNEGDEQQPPQRGSMRFQDAESTTPREPTLAEQRARRQAIAEERQREETEQEQRQEAERKAETKRKVLIGSGVTVGLVGLVAGWYLVAAPDEVTAVCTDENNKVVDERYCDEDYVASHNGQVGAGGLLFLPIPGGGGMGQYRYNYGGTGAVGTTVSGGSYTKPSGASISTKTGKVVQRGGFGISGGSFGKSGGFGS